MINTIMDWSIEEHSKSVGLSYGTWMPEETPIKQLKENSLMKMIIRLFMDDQGLDVNLINSEILMV